MRKKEEVKYLNLRSRQRKFRPISNHSDFRSRHLSPKNEIQADIKRKKEGENERNLSKKSSSRTRRKEQQGREHLFIFSGSFVEAEKKAHCRRGLYKTPKSKDCFPSSLLCSFVAFSSSSAIHPRLTPKWEIYKKALATFFRLCSFAHLFLRSRFHASSHTYCHFRCSLVHHQKKQASFQLMCR